MKIRIKGNSVRYRLTRSEVAKLHDSGYLEDHTLFGENKFTYALKKVEGAEYLSASLAGTQITVYVPSKLIEDWPVNNIVGFDEKMPLPGTGSLYILVEKDFMCLDETPESQADNYENPNKTC